MRDHYEERARHDQLVAVLLLLLTLIGVAGIHRFYTKRYISGVIWLLTWGLFGFGTLVDFILLLAARDYMLAPRVQRHRLQQRQVYGTPVYYVPVQQPLPALPSARPQTNFYQAPPQPQKPPVELDYYPDQGVPTFKVVPQALHEPPLSLPTTQEIEIPRVPEAKASYSASSAATSKRKSKKEENILALDFETANGARDACALGLYHMVNGEVVHAQEHLINPLGELDPRTMAVHGLSEEELLNAPPFAVAFKELKKQLKGDPLVLAHNASFDISVLRRNCARADITPPQLRYACTYKLSMAYFDDVPSCNLAALSKKLSLELDHHHALSDARASALIFNHLQEELLRKRSSVPSFMAKHKITFGEVSPEGHTPFSSRAAQAYKLPVVKTEEEALLFTNTAFRVAGELDHWTSKQLEELVTSRGGVLKKQVSRKVDVFVAGKPTYFGTQTALDEQVARARTLAELPGSKLSIYEQDDFVKTFDDSLASGINKFK